MIGKRITERGGSVDENQIHHAIEQAYQLIVEATGPVSPIRVYDHYRVIVAGPAWNCHGTLALSLGSHTVHAGQFSMEFFTSSRHGDVLTPV